MAGPFNVLHLAGGGTIETNFRIDNKRYGTPQQTPEDTPQHPHLMDLFEPTLDDGGSVAMVVLAVHGGNGSKESFQQQLLIKDGTDPPSQANVRWGIMQAAHCVVVTVENQVMPGGVVTVFNPNGNPNPQNLNSCQNFDQMSGADDVQMAKSWCIWARARYPGAILVYIGHSAGAFLGLRVWAEHVANMFQAYYIVSATAAIHYATTPPNPAIVKPICWEIGYEDDILAVKWADGTYHFEDAEWLQKQSQIAPIDVAWPLQTHRMGVLQIAQRATDIYNLYQARGAEVVGTVPDTDVPGHAGNIRTWKRGGTVTVGSVTYGKVMVRGYTYADHSMGKHIQACGTSILLNAIDFGYAVYLG